MGQSTKNNNNGYSVRGAINIKLPQKTNERMSIYLAAFTMFEEKGLVAITSTELEAEINIPATTIRRDLMSLGNNGTQRVGYNIEKMIDVIENYLKNNQITIGKVYIVYKQDMGDVTEKLFAIFNNKLAAELTVAEMQNQDLFDCSYMFKEHELNKIAIKGGK